MTYVKKIQQIGKKKHTEVYHIKQQSSLWKPQVTGKRGNVLSKNSPHYPFLTLSQSYLL